MPRRRRASTTQPSPPQREPGDPELCLVSEIGLEIWRGWCLCFPQNPKKQEGLCLVLRLNAADEIAGVQEAVLPEDADGGLGAAATPAEGATARRRLRRLVQSGPEQRQLLLKAREYSR